MIDPLVISFHGEFLLNTLLYGSDEFNYKINEEILLYIISNRVDVTGEARPGLPLFRVTKIKKGNKGKTEKVSKQKLLKGCHQGQNVTVLVIFTVLF